MGDNPFHLPIYFSEIEPLLQQVETGHHHHTIPGLEELVLCNDSSIVYSNRTVNDLNLQKLMGAGKWFFSSPYLLKVLASLNGISNFDLGVKQTRDSGNSQTLLVQTFFKVKLYSIFVSSYEQETRPKDK